MVFVVYLRQIYKNYFFIQPSNVRFFFMEQKYGIKVSIKY